MNRVEQELTSTIEVFQRVQQSPELITRVMQAGEACGRALLEGKKILLAGNGGSAADAQHIAAEFVVRMYADRRALPAIALTTDTSILTAAGNDYGFERVFARQLEALGRPGDVFVGISTSGSSANILRAMEVAREGGLVTIGLTGERTTAMSNLADILLQAPSARTQNVQEVHIMIGHTLCTIAEDAFLAESRSTS